jgi:molybdopterin synthase sulfur carrier subunit
MAIVTLRYWAAAKDAAGVADEKVEASTLAEALAAGLAAAGDKTGRLRQVLARSSFLVNGEPTGKRPPESITLVDDAVVEVLPPFAGG